MKILSRCCFAGALMAALGFCSTVSAQNPAPVPAPNPTPVTVVPSPAPGIPPFGWEEGLQKYLAPDAEFPISDTANLPTPDANFHMWSWEAFAWATALVTDPATGQTVPRFMTLATPEDLLSSSADAGKPHLRHLQLAARSEVLAGQNGFTEGAGAIVEADGNMMVGPNGYPVYASVHMNESYFNTAKENLIKTGAYEKNAHRGDILTYFTPGAAVFKATWLRLNPGEAPPAGAYVTTAQVPVLQQTTIPGGTTIAPVPGQFVTVQVALVGLHVVGFTINHPEFLWGTFEHVQNTPETPDGTFSTSGSCPTGYTFYHAGTSYAQVNNAVIPPQLALDKANQTVSPITNAVLENQTGGENQQYGPGNILALTASAQAFYNSLQKTAPAQSIFANYKLDGTVWLAPNSYSLTSGPQDAVGSADLANTTAETFLQQTNPTVANQQNCFLCHNATSYSFQTPPPKKLDSRLIAISHVLGVGTAYAVPNQISGAVGTPPSVVAPIVVPLDAARVKKASP